MSEPITAVFVYGTLQRGQCREKCWPHRPVKVEVATIRGRLYDLGPYPALVEGVDLIGGELWHLEPREMAETLAVLDEVEGADEGDASWYVRRVLECQGGRAYVYYYAKPETIADRPIVGPDAAGVCRWPK